MVLIVHYCTVEPMKKRQKVVVIVGPTSSGKSALAVSLARKFKGEVISADSRQVYRGLDIGTGKITKREMRGIPHHLLNEMSSHCIFTAHDFVTLAKQAVADISSKGKLPLIAGGTVFYIDALVGKIVLPNVPVNVNLRKRLEQMDVEKLFAILKKRDPLRAKNIDRHNKRRLVRALEIISALGHVPAFSTKDGPWWNVLWIGISRDKKELEKLIRARMHARMKAGMISEAIKLHRKGLSYRKMESFGLEYRSLALFLQKKMTREELEEKIVRDSLNYAKRQITYWNRNRKIIWFDMRYKARILKIVSNWLKK